MLPVQSSCKSIIPAPADLSDEYRDSTNSMRDPFQIAREEKGLSLLRA